MHPTECEHRTGFFLPGVLEDCNLPFAASIRIPKTCSLQRPVHYFQTTKTSSQRQSPSLPSLLGQQNEAKCSQHASCVLLIIHFTFAANDPLTDLSRPACRDCTKRSEPVLSLFLSLSFSRSLAHSLIPKLPSLHRSAARPKPCERNRESKDNKNTK